MVLINHVRAQGIETEIENRVSVNVMCETFFLLYQDIIFTSMVGVSVFASLTLNRARIKKVMFSLNK